MIYCKYEFTELPEILTSEEGLKDASVVIVGKLEETEGTYDEEGNVITAPVMSDKIAVDIIYAGEPEPSLEPFRVTPENPKHLVGGNEKLYQFSTAIKGITPKLIAEGHLRYFTKNMVIDSKGGKFSELPLDEIPTFREWAISNHPTEPEVLRKVYLVELAVTKDQVNLITLVRHTNGDGTKAEVVDALVQRIATNNVKDYEVEGQLIGERDYWDVLTAQGYTPYQLLDQRIPELDAAGLFNQY